MTFIPIVLLVVFSFLVAFLLTKWLIIYLEKKRVLDVPNQRSSHSKPIPRGGGIAIIAGFLVSIGLVKLIYPALPTPGSLFFTGVFLLLVIGFIDDKVTISPIVRFVVHIVSVGLVVYETEGFTIFPLPEPFSFSLEWAGFPLTFFWILAVMNIYNFLDGIDGYAGAQAFLCGIAFAVFDFGGTGTIVGITVAFSALGFLVFNWHPAKIFMGDVGSVTLGFVFATLPLYLSFREAYIGNFAAIIFLWFFLSDGAFTILQRMIQRKKIWEPHREHLYQIWIIKGRKHDQVVREVMMWASILIFAFFLFYYIKFDLLIFTFILGLVMFLVYLYRVKKYEKR